MHFVPFNATAQSNKETSITLSKIREQANSEINREKEGEAVYGQKSVILDVMAKGATEKGMTVEEYYIFFLTEKYKSEGYTIVDEQAEEEKVANLPTLMPSDLNAHLKSKGLKLYRVTNNSYWLYRINANETALDVSNTLEIPIDSLLPLTLIEVYDYNKGELRSNAWKEEEHLRKFLSPPYETYKRVTGFDGGDIFFPYDRNFKTEAPRPYNENITFANNLKTYSGNYKYEWDYNVNHNYSGKATYTYLENWDGSRTFEGNFSFVYDLNKKEGFPYEMDVVKINGQFKNNKQVGHWEFYRKSSDGVVTSITMDFDENGKLNGEAEMPQIFKAKFSHGKLVYVIWMEDWNGYSTRGYFTDDERPKGEWKLSTNEKLQRRLGKSGEKPTITKYDSSGCFIKSGYRDESTGDWHDTHNRFPDEIPEKIARVVNEYLMRDTPPYQPIRH